MSVLSPTFPPWLTAWMESQDILLWGAADLRDFSTPRDEAGRDLLFALSWGIPMDPHIMVSVHDGPHQAYADKYARVNNRLEELSKALEASIIGKGFRATTLTVSNPTNEADFRGEFPHKTAATRAGLGWVGRNCQLITHRFGPWLRRGTVFTDMRLPCGPPMEHTSCGRCTRCVDACPAHALKGNAWHPGIPREEILDVQACDRWKRNTTFSTTRDATAEFAQQSAPMGQKF